MFSKQLGSVGKENNNQSEEERGHRKSVLQALGIGMAQKFDMLACIQSSFLFYNSDPNTNLCREDIKNLFTDISVENGLPPISIYQINKIIELFDDDGDGEISLKELTDNLVRIDKVTEILTMPKKPLIEDLLRKGAEKFNKQKSNIITKKMQKKIFDRIICPEMCLKQLTEAQLSLIQLCSSDKNSSMNGRCTLEEMINNISTFYHILMNTNMRLVAPDSFKAFIKQKSMKNSEKNIKKDSKKIKKKIIEKIETLNSTICEDVHDEYDPDLPNQSQKGPENIDDEIDADIEDNIKTKKGTYSAHKIEINKAPVDSKSAYKINKNFIKNLGQDQKEYEKLKVTSIQDGLLDRKNNFGFHRSKQYNDHELEDVGSENKDKPNLNNKVISSKLIPMTSLQNNKGSEKTNYEQDDKDKKEVESEFSISPSESGASSKRKHQNKCKKADTMNDNDSDDDDKSQKIVPEVLEDSDYESVMIRVAAPFCKKCTFESLHSSRKNIKKDEKVPFYQQNLDWSNSGAKTGVGNDFINRVKHSLQDNADRSSRRIYSKTMQNIETGKMDSMCMDDSSYGLNNERKKDLLMLNEHLRRFGETKQKIDYFEKHNLGYLEEIFKLVLKEKNKILDRVKKLENFRKFAVDFIDIKIMDINLNKKPNDKEQTNKIMEYQYLIDNYLNFTQNSLNEHETIPLINKNIQLNYSIKSPIIKCDNEIRGGESRKTQSKCIKTQSLRYKPSATKQLSISDYNSNQTPKNRIIQGKYYNSNFTKDSFNFGFDDEFSQNIDDYHQRSSCSPKPSSKFSKKHHDSNNTTIINNNNSIINNSSMINNINNDNKMMKSGENQKPQGTRPKSNFNRQHKKSISSNKESNIIVSADKKSNNSGSSNHSTQIRCKSSNINNRTSLKLESNQLLVPENNGILIKDILSSPVEVIHKKIYNKSSSSGPYKIKRDFPLETPIRVMDKIVEETLKSNINSRPQSAYQMTLDSLEKRPKIRFNSISTNDKIVDSDKACLPINHLETPLEKKPHSGMRNKIRVDRSKQAKSKVTIEKLLAINVSKKVSQILDEEISNGKLEQETGKKTTNFFARIPNKSDKK